MSKKLVEEALSDEPVVTLSVDTPTGADINAAGGVDAYIRKSFSRMLVNGKFVVSDEPQICEVLPVYPPNITDQTHGLSIADQLHRGQGDGTDLDSSAYDFPDGRDDGREAISPFAYSEPAEAWEAEQNFKTELTAQAREQVRAAKEQADNALQKTISDASKAGQKSSENVSDEAADDKSLVTPK